MSLVHSSVLLVISCCLYVQACRSASQSEEQLLLLHVEEQAMVQVVIKEVAAHLDMKDTSKINTVRIISSHLHAF